MIFLRKHLGIFIFFLFLLVVLWPAVPPIAPVHRDLSYIQSFNPGPQWPVPVKSTKIYSLQQGYPSAVTVPHGINYANKSIDGDYSETAPGPQAIAAQPQIVIPATQPAYTRTKKRLDIHSELAGDHGEVYFAPAAPAQAPLIGLPQIFIPVTVKCHDL